MASLNTPDSDWMSRVSRRKLSYSAAAGSRDNLTLHRWVLLRNLVVASSSSHPATSADELTADEQAATTAPPFEYASQVSEQDVFVFPDADIFEFPDAASLTRPEGVADESAWLEALLDELENEDDDDDEDVDFDVVDAAEVPTVTFPAASTSAPPVPAPAPAPELALPISLFPASPSSASTSADPLSSEQSHSVALSTCNCITPPPTPSSSLRSPSLFDDLPFGDCDGSDDMSDDESEGPDTPLTLSHLHHGSSAAVAAEPAVVLPDTDDSYSYFFRPPIARSPLSPHSPEPFPLQEC